MMGTTSSKRRDNGFLSVLKARKIDRPTSKPMRKQGPIKLLHSVASPQDRKVVSYGGRHLGLASMAKCRKDEKGREKTPPTNYEVDPFGLFRLTAVPITAKSYHKPV